MIDKYYFISEIFNYINRRIFYKLILLMNKYYYNNMPKGIIKNIMSKNILHNIILSL